MKKRFLLILTVAFMLMLTACSGNSSNDGETSKGKDKDVYKLKMNVAFQKGDDGDVVSLSTEKFAEEVYERTNGRVDIEVYYSAQLLPVDQMLSGLEKGTIDLAYTLPEYYGEYAPTGYYGSLPFLGKNIDEYVKLLREDGIATIMEEEFAEKGAKILLYGTPGEYGILSNKSIKSVEDMKGLTIRAGNSLWVNWYKKLGAAPANIPTTDVYQALQLGTIDAVPYSLNTIEFYNFHEVVSSMTAGIRVSALSSVMMSNKTWEKLPEDLQKIILEVAAETEQKNIQFYRDTLDRPYEFAAEKGVEVNTLSDTEYDRFVESGQVVWDEFASLSDRTKQISDILKAQLAN